MNITATAHFAPSSRSHAPSHSHCGAFRPHHSHQGGGAAHISSTLSSFASNMGRSEQLASQWQSLSEPLRGSAPFLPTTEMSRNQSLQNGRTNVSVDGQGNMTANTAPAGCAHSPEGGSPSLGEQLLGSLMQMLSRLSGGEGGSCGGMRGGDPWGVGGGESAPAQAPTSGDGQAGPGGLKFENGQIITPDGQRIPFGNTGVIVKMPDGTQVAVGRNSQNDTQHVRWVTAGPGEQIPTSPPGATNLFTYDESGKLSQSGVK